MPRRQTARNDELSTRPRIREKLTKLAADVEKAFRDQSTRTDDQLDYWDCYNCELGPKQAYNGNSKLFVPIVHDAVNARKTRFTNQVFPKSGRYVEVITENGDIPTAETALLEAYVRKAKLRTMVAPALNKNGDIEGQFNVYCFWRTKARHVAWTEDKPVTVMGIEHPGIETVEAIRYDIITDDYPDVEVLSDADVVIWPATCDSIEDAIEQGGGVAIIRRWTESKIRQLVKDGEIVKDIGDKLQDKLSSAATKRDAAGRTNVPKEHADAAGIKAKGGHYLAYEAWTKLKVDGVMRLCRSYLGGEGTPVLGCKLNPYWCDLCPAISVPVEKVSGVAKGIAPVKFVADLQYQANDVTNEGADSSHLSMMPIIKVDPIKVPNWTSLVVDLGAIWAAAPGDIDFAKFPELWRSAIDAVGSITQQIFRTLGVNPAMIPQSSGRPGAKRNQAEIANEQAVDILTTADAVMVQEEGVWTPIIERFAAYDAQFRNKEITVRAYGPMGRRVAIEKVPPLQLGRRYEFRWFGVEAARNLAESQQQIAAVNVVTRIPPQLTPGRRINLTPAIDQLMMNVFGPRIAPLTFEDLTKQLSMDPAEENPILVDGFDLPVSPLDNDIEHLQSHHAAIAGASALGQQHLRVHMMAHQAQLAAKNAQVQGPAPKPGVSGPQAGARPTAPRAGKGPPGLVPPDGMARAGAVTMPRKM